MKHYCCSDPPDAGPRRVAREPSGRITSHGLAAFGAAALFVIYQFGVQTSYSVLHQALKVDLHIRDFQFALSSAAFLISYGLLQFPAGLLLDRLGPGRLLWIGALALGGSVWLLSLADSFGMLLACRALMGMASSLAFAGAGIVARRGLPAWAFPVAMGVADSGIGLGGALGEVATSALVESWGWRVTVGAQAMLALPVIGFCLVAVSTCQPLSSPSQGAAVSESVWRSICSMFSKRDVVRAAVIYGSSWGILLGYGSLWNRRLLQAFGWSADEVALVCTSFFLGMVVGAPVSAFLAVRFGLRRVLLVSLALGCLIFAFSVFIKVPVWLEACMAAAIGLSFTVSQLAFTVACNAVEPRDTAAAIGVVNASALLGGALLQAAPAGILSFLGGNALADLQAANLVFLGAGAAAFLGAWSTGTRAVQIAPECSTA